MIFWQQGTFIEIAYKTIHFNPRCASRTSKCITYAQRKGGEQVHYAYYCFVHIWRLKILKKNKI